MSKKSGSKSLFGFGNNDDEQDDYNYTLDDKKFSYQSRDGSDSDISFADSPPRTTVQKKVPTVSTSNLQSSTVGNSTDSAMERAKNMLSKYSNKSTNNNTNIGRSKAALEFDEDNISLGSSEGDASMEDSDGPISTKRIEPKVSLKKTQSTKSLSTLATNENGLEFVSDTAINDKSKNDIGATKPYSGLGSSSTAPASIPVSRLGHGNSEGLSKKNVINDFGDSVGNSGLMEGSVDYSISVEESASVSYVGPSPIVGKSAVTRPDASSHGNSVIKPAAAALTSNTEEDSYSMEYAIEGQDDANNDDEIRSMEDPEYSPDVDSEDEGVDDDAYQPEKPKIMSFADFASDFMAGSDWSSALQAGDSDHVSAPATTTTTTAAAAPRAGASPQLDSSQHPAAPSLVSKEVASSSSTSMVDVVRPAKTVPVTSTSVNGSSQPSESIRAVTVTAAATSSATGTDTKSSVSTRSVSSAIDTPLQLVNSKSNPIAPLVRTDSAMRPVPVDTGLSVNADTVPSQPQQSMSPRLPQSPHNPTGLHPTHVQYPPVHPPTAPPGAVYEQPPTQALGPQSYPYPYPAPPTAPPAPYPYPTMPTAPPPQYPAYPYPAYSCPYPHPQMSMQMPPVNPFPYYMPPPPAPPAPSFFPLNPFQQSAPYTANHGSSATSTDPLVFELLKELQLARKEAAVSNRRLTELLVHMQRDKDRDKDRAREKFYRSQGSPQNRGKKAVSPTKSPVYEKNNTNKEEYSEDYEDEDEDEEYEADFEPGTPSPGKRPKATEAAKPTSAPAVDIPESDSDTRPSKQRSTSATDEKDRQHRGVGNGNGNGNGRRSSCTSRAVGRSARLSVREDVLEDDFSGSFADADADALLTDPLSGTLLASQALFRRQLDNLRQRLAVTNRSAELTSAFLVSDALGTRTSNFQNKRLPGRR